MMRRDDAPAPSGEGPLDPPARHDEGGEGEKEREAWPLRVAFRDSERAGAIDILSFGPDRACRVHTVAGLALHNLAVLSATALRRGAKGGAA